MGHNSNWFRVGEQRVLEKTCRTLRQMVLIRDFRWPGVPWDRRHGAVVARTARPPPLAGSREPEAADPALSAPRLCWPLTASPLMSAHPSPLSGAAPTGCRHLLSLVGGGHCCGNVNSRGAPCPRHSTGMPGAQRAVFLLLSCLWRVANWSPHPALSRCV